MRECLHRADRACARRSRGPQITGPQITGPQITGPQITGPQITGPVRLTGAEVDAWQAVVGDLLPKLCRRAQRERTSD